jgi:cyclophilin family peptidyl-prolyl cis-trans isomerase
MKMIRRAEFLLGLVAVAFAAMLAALPIQSVYAQSGTPHLLLELKDGTVDIELLPEVAPKHVERVIALTEKGAYDNVLFHRVIDGFMAQTGDVQFGKSDGPDFNPGRAGTGGSDMPDVVAEFSDLHYDRGVLGAARTADPNTFNSQFFITFADAGFLDGQYTIFGKVVSGMEFVDNITKGEPPTNPDKIVSAKIEYR